jgi:hypothetical protein
MLDHKLQKDREILHIIENCKIKKVMINLIAKWMEKDHRKLNLG